jgi:hypothetical protein
MVPRVQWKVPWFGRSPHNKHTKLPSLLDISVACATSQSVNKTMCNGFKCEQDRESKVQL